MRNARSARPSVRHGGHLPGQSVLEAKILQIPHSLRIKNAVEMIDLVLYDARVKSLHGAVDGRAGEIEALIAHTPRPRHEPAHPRHRQAAFPALLLFGIERG